MRSEAEIRERLVDIIRRARPTLSASQEWPGGILEKQREHWFYCLVWTLNVQRERGERLADFMDRIEKEFEGGTS